MGKGIGGVALASMNYRLSEIFLSSLSLLNETQSLFSFLFLSFRDNRDRK
jgi:hypothetical protein